MGILNTTPDSFFDGGSLYKNGKLDLDLALIRAEDMVSNGAAILDIGGESTRPGAKPISNEEEMDRVVPIVESIVSRLDVVISVDTSKPKIMEAAVSSGAHMINDVKALSEPHALEVIAGSKVNVCLMHMLGNPITMQTSPEYKSVNKDVKQFLIGRIEKCKQVGISRERLILDPGFGFGKTVAHNLELLGNLRDLAALDCPILVGLSRKSMINKILKRNIIESLPATLGLVAIALERGANLIRAHDVRETADVISMWMAVNRVENGSE
ncbi:MAG: dihydropteroate synthase [Halieaceae bacterium]|nr:dihydropteroate synthase [Halieaceae bacterium]